MTHRSRWLVLLVSLQVIFLIALAVTSYAAAWLGQSIKVKTVPVDPRDVLYGDYVTLQYDMSRIPTAMWHGKDALPESGMSVYTVLAPEGDYYLPVAAYDYKPVLKAEEVVIKGIVMYSWSEEIAVRYGVERYYIPEGTGREIESSTDRLIVTIHIAPWGQNVITLVEER